MSYKSLLVVMDNAVGGAAKLEYAASLAANIGASMVGIYAGYIPTIPSYVSAQVPASFYEAQRETWQEENGRAADDFKKACDKHGVAGEWRDLTPGGEILTSVIAMHARYADLVVLSQSDDERDIPLIGEIAASLPMDCGRPVLVVPYAGTFSAPPKRVLIGWDASRESTRAIHDALPLLVSADKVTVVTVNPEQGTEAHGQIPGADIALTLARHNVTVEVKTIYEKKVGAGDAILSCAADEGADLIVMGSYGHSRVREMILGGATRTMLSSMTAPVLMSH
ncbi:MAG: universal stress protein [Pseudomonadota bacterium]